MVHCSPYHLTENNKRPYEAILSSYSMESSGIINGNLTLVLSYKATFQREFSL